MELLFCGHDYKYAVEQLMLLMFPEERPEYVEADGGAPAFAEVRLSPEGDFSETLLRLGGKSARGEARLDGAPPSDPLLYKRETQKLVKLSFFRAARELTGVTPPWGALTGIRPGKLAERFMRQTGLGRDAAAEFIEREYYVSPRRAALCAAAADEAEKLRKSLDKNDISLYIGIPFCPTRCAYCSFVSHSVEKSLKLIAPYLEALQRETAAAGRLAAELGLRVVSVYIGGGTPTTLSAEELSALLACVRGAFDLSACREFTVEAGRPDTITREKLQSIEHGGADRISINPQTMSDAVLAAIGRRHSGAAVTESYHLAREVFSGAVNMDLIAGLPGDSAEGFAASLDAVIALEPENITVHTLSLKRGSRIGLEGTPLPDGETVAGMLDYAASALGSADYSPYYLYRQKFTSGGFENVGWTKPGFTGVYNICMMEELHSTLSLGAGGVTKLVNPETGLIERIFNKKYPYEYIESIDELIAAKDYMKAFYNKMRG